MNYLLSNNKSTVKMFIVRYSEYLNIWKPLKIILYIYLIFKESVRIIDMNKMRNNIFGLSMNARQAMKTAERFTYNQKENLCRSEKKSLMYKIIR